VADVHVACVSVPHWWAEAVQCLATKNMAVVPHTPYLPCDLLSFPWMKSKLQGHWVQLPLKQLLSYMWFQNVSSSSAFSSGKKTGLTA
jgi:hypothetical protein